MGGGVDVTVADRTGAAASASWSNAEQITTGKQPEALRAFDPLRRPLR